MIRFRPGHVPDFQTKYQHDALHHCSCGFFADRWDALIGHCMVPTGQQARAA